MGDSSKGVFQSGVDVQFTFSIMVSEFAFSSEFALLVSTLVSLVLRDEFALSSDRRVNRSIRTNGMFLVRVRHGCI